MKPMVRPRRRSSESNRSGFALVDSGADVVDGLLITVIVLSPLLPLAVIPSVDKKHTSRWAWVARPSLRMRKRLEVHPSGGDESPLHKRPGGFLFQVSVYWRHRAAVAAAEG